MRDLELSENMQAMCLIRKQFSTSIEFFGIPSKPSKVYGNSEITLHKPLFISYLESYHITRFQVSAQTFSRCLTPRVKLHQNGTVYRLTEYIIRCWTLGVRCSSVFFPIKLDASADSGSADFLLNRQMDHCNAVGEFFIVNMGETNFPQQRRQFIGHWKHSNGFRKMGVGFARSGNQFSQKWHDIKRIKIVQPPERHKCRF